MYKRFFYMQNEEESYVNTIYEIYLLLKLIETYIQKNVYFLSCFFSVLSADKYYFMKYCY